MENCSNCKFKKIQLIAHITYAMVCDKLINDLYLLDNEEVMRFTNKEILIHLNFKCIYWELVENKNQLNIIF